MKDTLNLTEQLDHANAHLASLSESIDTSSAVGRMVFKMLSTLNEFERDVLAERTRNALGHMRRLNRRISGKIPFGYVLDSDGATLQPVESEQATIQQIVERRQKGDSLASIAAAMEAGGVQTKTGGMWHASTVAAILNRSQLLAA